MPRRDDLVYILILAILTLGVYYDSFNNAFVYDDYPFLVENPAVKDMGAASIPSVFSRYERSSSSANLSRDVWRPLMVLSFALDYRLWGLDSRMYHIENTFLHLLNSSLVYVLTILVVGNPLVSFIAAAVFAIHPVQTEAVAWVSGRANMLFLFFFLLALISHIRGRLRRGAAGALGPCLIFFALGLFSKEMAIVLPLVMLTYDILFVRDRDAAYYISYYAPMALVAVSYLAARYSVLGVIAQKPEWWGGGFLQSMAMTVKAVSAYIMLAIFPVNLGIDYAPEVARQFAGTPLAAAVLAPAAAIALYVVFRRDRRVSFYILWFFVTLIPVYNIVPFKAVMAERFMYLPLIGFASLFGLLFGYLNASSRIGRTIKALSGITLAAILAGYGCQSIARNIEWRDELSFYGREAARSPASAKAHYNYGYACAKEAAAAPGGSERAGVHYALAMSEYAKAIALKPQSQEPYIGMANAANSVGMYDAATANFMRALSISEHADIYNNLGVAYYNKGDYAKAYECFMRALRMDPKHANAMVNLGNVYHVRGDILRAKAMWMRAIKAGAGPSVYLKKLLAHEGAGI